MIDVIDNDNFTTQYEISNMSVSTAISSYFITVKLS